MPKPAIQIANNVYRVPTMGSAINSFMVIEEDSSVTIIDAGLKHAYKKIISALDYLGSSHSDVRRILFTHSHSDHTDGAPKLIQKLGTPKVYAHEEELKYMETGENPPRDLSHLAGLFFRFMPFGKHEPVKVDEAILGLIDNPRPVGCKKLQGFTNTYRIKTGNYRILYRIEDKALIIEVIRVADRKNAYR